MTLRALQITDTDGGETYVSFEAPNWGDDVRRYPFSYRILKDHFIKWADDNLPPHWMDDRFAFIAKGVLFVHKEDALLAYLAFR